MRKYIFIGLIILILCLVIIGSYFLLHNNGERQTPTTFRGILLSSCNLENYDECISRIGMKSGPEFAVCRNNIKVLEAPKNSDCITIVSPLNSESISDKQLREFKNYLNKEVEISGTERTIKRGVSGPNCNMVQIGCERDIDVFILKTIRILNQ